MKKLFSLLVAVFMIGTTFAITNVTEEDLDGIIKEVNQIIENEIVIANPTNQTVTGSLVSGNLSTGNSIPVSTGDLEACEAEKPCGDEMELAITKLNKFGATKFSTPKDFMTDKNIRRDEAAKMYLKFFEGTKKLPAKNSGFVCKFSDLDKAWSDIVPMIGQVCEYGLFKGSKGKFMPLNNITKGQAVIVLIRAIDGKKEEVNGVKHYAQNYIKKAKELNLLSGLNMDSISSRDESITRGGVAKLLYRASNLK